MTAFATTRYPARWRPSFPCPIPVHPRSVPNDPLLLEDAQGRGGAAGSSWTG